MIAGYIELLHALGPARAWGTALANAVRIVFGTLWLLVVWAWIRKAVAVSRMRAKGGTAGVSPTPCGRSVMRGSGSRLAR